MSKTFIDTISNDKFKCYVHYNPDKIHITVYSKYDNYITSFGHSFYPESNNALEILKYRIANVKRIIDYADKFRTAILKHMAAVKMFLDLDDNSILPRNITLASDDFRTVLVSNYNSKSFIGSISNMNDTNIGDIKDLCALYSLCTSIDVYCKNLLDILTKELKYNG